MRVSDHAAKAPTDRKDSGLTGSTALSSSTAEDWAPQAESKLDGAEQSQQYFHYVHSIMLQHAVTRHSLQQLNEYTT